MEFLTGAYGFRSSIVHNSMGASTWPRLVEGLGMRAMFRHVSEQYDLRRSVYNESPGCCDNVESVITQLTRERCLENTRLCPRR